MVFKKKPAVLNKIDEMEAVEVKEKVSKLTKDSVANELAKLAVTLNTALGDVSAKYQQSLTTLESINKNIAFETTELERLRNIKVNADTLAQLEADIEAKRESWKKEQEEVENQRRKDNAEFEYEREQERKREEDNYLEEKTAREKVLADKELAMHLAEKELQDLRVMKEEFTVTKEKYRDEIIKGKVQAKEFEHEKSLSSANVAAEKKVMEQNITSLQKEVDALKEQNNVLRSDLDKARNDAKEVATKALEASANKETINALHKAMETNANAGNKK